MIIKESIFFADVMINYSLLVGVVWSIMRPEKRETVNKSV